MQVIRWYLCPLQTDAAARLMVPPALRKLVQGRWTIYRLPGMAWALVRVRGEDVQHAGLTAAPGIFEIPRGRTQRWSAAAPLALRNRLTALGIDVSDNPFPDQVLDRIGESHRTLYANPLAWDRAKEKRSDESTLSAVEEV